MASPLASLSSGLLARKGGARPAMRPQGFAGYTHPAAEDDLGWNDMGASQPAASQPASPSPLPAPAPVEVTADEPAAEAPLPPVLIEREALAEQIAAPEPARTVSLATAQRIRRETAHKGKAAFTLRLDADRHLQLRLASAISNRSSQALVTLALDALIAAMPDVATLVAQLPPPAAKRAR